MFSCLRLLLFFCSTLCNDFASYLRFTLFVCCVFSIFACSVDFFEKVGGVCVVCTRFWLMRVYVCFFTFASFFV
jgi:hypothetical protein